MDQKTKQVVVGVAAVLAWAIAIIQIFDISFGSTSSRTVFNSPAGDTLLVARKKLPPDLGFYEYSPAGIGDPFGGYEKLQLKNQSESTGPAPVEPTVSSLKLAGIMWDPNEAMALVLTNDGKNHAVKIGDVIGGEQIKAIAEDYIVVERVFLKKKLKFELKQGGGQKKL